MLNGQVAVVACSGGELGAAVAAALAAAGCRVRLAQPGTPAEAERWLDGIVDELGGLDVLVHAEPGADAYPVCRAGLSRMAARRRGQIVQVAVGQAGYGPGAVADMLNEEARPRGVRVSGIYQDGAPGAEAVAAAVMFALTTPPHLRVDRLVLQRMG